MKRQSRAAKRCPDKAQFPNLYPSASLYDHEWDRHGTCSGSTPESYLSLAKRLKESIVIPARYKVPEQPVRVTTAQFNPISS